MSKGMNIRGIFLACAASCTVFSLAHAEDAVVADDPLQIQPVNVCEAYGPGYALMPGTATCMKVSGQLRYEKSISSDKRSGLVHGSNGRFTLDFETRSD